MWRIYLQEHQSLGPLYRRVGGKPGWVGGAALLAATLVVVVPLLLLFAAAVFVGVVVFVMLSMIVWVIRMIQRLGARLALSGGGVGSDGRRNVRVIQRD